MSDACMALIRRLDHDVKIGHSFESEPPVRDRVIGIVRMQNVQLNRTGGKSWKRRRQSIYREPIQFYQQRVMPLLRVRQRKGHYPDRQK